MKNTKNFSSAHRKTSTHVHLNFSLDFKLQYTCKSKSYTPSWNDKHSLIRFFLSIKSRFQFQRGRDLAHYFRNRKFLPTAHCTVLYKNYSNIYFLCFNLAIATNQFSTFYNIRPYFVNFVNIYVLEFSYHCRRFCFDTFDDFFE